MTLGKFIFGLFAVIGLGASIAAWLMFESRQAFLAAAQPAEGTVVELDLVRSSSGSGSGSSYSYYPIVRFRTLGLDPEPYLKGETVPVLIDPRNPKRHALDLSFLPEPAG